MSSQRQATARDLVEEAKKRIVILVICVVGLSYLMSLTSSSVLVNLPAAASLIILLRYFSLDYEMKRKAAMYNSSKPSSDNAPSKEKPVNRARAVEKSDWRRKVNSPAVEEAIDHFTRHLVAEWVTDLWYGRLTPDREAPEELVYIINSVMGELSSRVRNINIIDLLTRDLVNLVCTHLELYRACQAKIEKRRPGSLSIEQRDRELKLVLAAEKKLHPALFSPEAEHKVLQHLMDGLISLTLNSADLQCVFFRYVARELLACTVIRPVLNLASPRFINERIEMFVISKTNKGVAAAQEAAESKASGSSRISSDQFSRVLDPTGTGVELVQINSDQSRNGKITSQGDTLNGVHVSKDPLLSIDTQSSRKWNSLPLKPETGDEVGIQRHHSGGEWGEMLDMVSRRKTATLAPENLENMWTKGRNYKKKEGVNRVIEQVPQYSSVRKSVTAVPANNVPKPKRDGLTKNEPSLVSKSHSQDVDRASLKHKLGSTDLNASNHSVFTSLVEDDEVRDDEGESNTSDSYTSEEEDINSVMGLDSPGTKVWDGKTNRNQAVSHIHHPLENSDGRISKRTGKGHTHHRRSSRPESSRKRSRSSTQKLPVWQEVERTSFLSGDGMDILGSRGLEKDDTSDDSDIESSGRVFSGSTASSSAPCLSIPQSHSLSATSLKSSLMVDSFFKLKCEVLGANIVKSDSRSFAVYSISVTDVTGNNWSIKRRYRHFEELHRRLKEYPEYNLHLPPKHFLSTGLDLLVIQERCRLLDRYLKMLLQLPTISGSIEVWDFLSVDSQTYVFSDSFSIVETLSVDLDHKRTEKYKMVSNFPGPVSDSLTTRREQIGMDHKEPAFQTKHNSVADSVRMNVKDKIRSPVKRLDNEAVKSFEDSGSDSELHKAASSVRNVGKVVREREVDGVQKSLGPLEGTDTDPTLPTEWVPPSLTVPLLDLIDVIFQLQDGGWIRRKAFWLAKQILQLGMGDALDDWLIEKIQVLRRGAVVASGIKKVEQILWPDGIFITKHPNRRPPSSSPQKQQSEMLSPKLSSSNGQKSPGASSPRLIDQQQQQQEADRRAKFVYELMIDNAPPAIVSLVGRKDYEQCAKDLYFFLQSSICLKQLAFDLLELLLLSAFPELDRTFRELHEESDKFGAAHDSG
ncbi:hypothetical protein Tsubulata_040936 [Turnera subulata]|uniref:PX domain-containing protein n=1 Tax=Turnera subulata TaxID=218843 RepID=A0A9Q0G5F8_9ROSI|nr:hypothetical protein Tsubulata_040936 [Turnera subulata]